MNSPCFHLLHIDDDQSDAFFFERAVKQCGKDVVSRWVQSGDLALAHLNDVSNPRPNLIVCDVKMPGMSGFEFLKLVRGSADHRRIPVVMLSGSLMAADVHMAFDLGANAYLGKPSSPAELSRMVTRLIEFWWGACVCPSTGSQRITPAIARELATR